MREILHALNNSQIFFDDSFVVHLGYLLAFRDMDTRLLDMLVRDLEKHPEEPILGKEKKKQQFRLIKRLQSVITVPMRHIELFAIYCIDKLTRQSRCHDVRNVRLSDGSSVAVYRLPVEAWQHALTELGLAFFCNRHYHTSPHF